MIWRRFLDRMRKAAELLQAAALGTIFAFLFLLFWPVFAPVRHILETYLKLTPPAHSRVQFLVLLLLLLLIGLLSPIPKKTWRSLRLGLVPFQNWIWVVSIVVFWISLEWHHTALAWSSFAFAGLLRLVVALVDQGSPRTTGSASRLMESDLPVPENGEDLLGRRETIEGLVSTILLEQPQIIAVTGAYGEGKTSVLNLTIGELKKLNRDDVPVIVRFSPWLAADSNTLVVSLLNSVVAEIKGNFVVPGLGRDAAQFARTLLSVIPKAERFKDLIAESSQEERILALANHVARTRRRVLVVLDDLDRLEAKELETVFKLLRGSDKLSTLTFLCSFHQAELALILKTTRPAQDTAVFIEKFFTVLVPLPKVEPSQLQNYLSQKISELLGLYGPSQEDLSTTLEKIWEKGASLYFPNLRRIKLFLNKIGHSLERIADEINIGDFIKLELIRDIAPDVYERIYVNPEYFYSRDLAFETGFKGPSPLDDKEAKKERAAFYNKIKASVPTDKHYVFQLVEDLFPNFAEYNHARYWTIHQVGAEEAEKSRRIFHPRCFQQYFLLKVPSELFSQKEFKAFLSSLRHLDEDGVIVEFNKAFRHIVNEDFKRWHLMHLIETSFDEFGLAAACGLCRGMAQNSALWSFDAFELMIAIRTTRGTLRNIADSGVRQELLRAIVRESASDFYTLTLVWRLEASAKEHFDSSETDCNIRLLSDLQEMKVYLTKHLHSQYMRGDAPSVFEQFGIIGSHINRIEPISFLIEWKRLGPDASSDQTKYLQGLLTESPKDLDEFLKRMFRVDFIDDYSALKQLVDYKILSELIKLNERTLDPEKVQQFRKRYGTETASKATDESPNVSGPGQLDQ
jgi:KAP family P-loop domain